MNKLWIRLKDVMVNWGDPIVLEHGMILNLHFFGIV